MLPLLTNLCSQLDHAFGPRKYRGLNVGIPTRSLGDDPIGIDIEEGFETAAKAGPYLAAEGRRSDVRLGRGLQNRTPIVEHDETLQMERLPEFIQVGLGSAIEMY